jgi:hypothetical protein
MLSTSDFIAPPRGDPWLVVDETCCQAELVEMADTDIFYSPVELMAAPAASLRLAPCANNVTNGKI